MTPSCRSAALQRAAGDPLHRRPGVHDRRAFYYTAHDEATLLDTSKHPDVVVNVIGKKWSWDFNYVEREDVEAATQAELTGEPGAEASLPTLYSPSTSRSSSC